MFAVVAEVLSHGGARVRCKILHRRGVRGGSFDDDRVVHGAKVLQRLDDLGHRRRLLANGDVNTNYVFSFLIDDGVNRYCSLPSLAITDDQLALTTTDGDHGVDGFESSLERLFNWLSINHTGSDAFHRGVVIGDNWATLVDGIAEHIDHATDERVSDGDLHDATGALYQVTFFNRVELAEQHRTDFVLFEIQSETAHV